LSHDPRLDRKPARLSDSLLVGDADCRERFACGDPELRLDEVQSQDLLGNRVLDLDAWIAFDEEVQAAGRVDQELDRAPERCEWRSRRGWRSARVLTSSFPSLGRPVVGSVCMIKQYLTPRSESAMEGALHPARAAPAESPVKQDGLSVRPGRFCHPERSEGTDRSTEGAVESLDPPRRSGWQSQHGPKPVDNGSRQNLALGNGPAPAA